MNTVRPSNPLRGAFNFAAAEFAAYKISLVISVLVGFFGLILAQRLPQGLQSTGDVISVVGGFLLFCWLWNKLALIARRELDRRSADVEAQNRVNKLDQEQAWRRSRGL